MILDEETYSIDKAMQDEELYYKFNCYSKGYFDAANLVSEKLLEKYTKDISKLDTFIFPLTFLYRHSLELLLKAALFKNIMSINERIEIIKETRHDLKKLFDEIVKYNKFSDDEFKWLGDFLGNISNVDKDSDSFRYPFKITSNGSCSIFTEGKFLDINKHIEKFVFAYLILEKRVIENDNVNVDFHKYNTLFMEKGRNYRNSSAIGMKFSINDYYPYLYGYYECASIIHNSVGISVNTQT